MVTFRNRLPQPREILYVFGGVVFIVYSWAIRGFLYQLSSLLLYHTVGEILAVFSYLMAIALVESLILIFGLILLGFILPGNWFREGFVYKGFIAMLVAGSGMLWLHYYLYSLNYGMPPWNVIYLGLGTAIFLLISFIWVIQKAPKLQSFLISIQERLLFFMYLYVFLGLLGLTVVITRNVF